MGATSSVRLRKPLGGRPQAAVRRGSGAVSTKSGSALHDHVLDLQQRAGNRAVSAMIQRLVTPASPEAAVAADATEQQHRTLRIGDTGEEVKTLQMKLMRKAFRRNLDKLDGIFGPKTRADIIQFQSTHGLAADGVVGTKTWNALDAYTPEAVHEAEENAADETFAQALAAQNAKDFGLAIDLYTAVLGMPATTAKEVMTGSLINRGICFHQAAMYGRAVADLERGLDATHISAGRRAEALAALRLARLNLPPGSDPKTPMSMEGDGGGITERPELAPGTAGPEVEVLQMKLFGTQVITGTPQPQAGVFDASTLARLRAFKSEVGLGSTPVADAATWHALDTYVPEDRTDADRQRYLAGERAMIAAYRTNPANMGAEVDALLDLAWTPELRALPTDRRARMLHAQGAFAEAIATYRQALELPRLERSLWDPGNRAETMELILMARRGQKLGH